MDENTISILQMVQKKEELRQGGGNQALSKQHSLGKNSARERIAKLTDEGSFYELGIFSHHQCKNFGMDEKAIPCDAVVTGIATINGRRVCISSQDFTSQGGSLGLVHAKKIIQLQENAFKIGCPIIQINDSGGARIQEGVDSLAGFGEIFFNNVKLSGVVPQISLIMGPCAGGAVYSPALCDFIIIVDKTSYMFITGPNVLKTVSSQVVTSEELGGAEIHTQKSGVADFFVKDEEEAFVVLKELLSYLPQNNLDDQNKNTLNGNTNLNSNLEEIIPSSFDKGYDIKKFISAIVDNASYLEVKADWAKNAVCCFAKIGGKSVGIVANQPFVNAGCLDINSSDKIARFIRTCDAFNIPILTLVDTPGFLPGVNQEYDGIIRHGAKVLYAYSEATVPKITLIIRKAYGGAYIAMGSKHLGADLVLSYPFAQIAVMGAEGAANIIFSKDIKNSSNPEQTRIEKIDEYKKTFMNPYDAASKNYIDDIITYDETRSKILAALVYFEDKRCAKVQKKHGNIPL